MPLNILNLYGLTRVPVADFQHPQLYSTCGSSVASDEPETIFRPPGNIATKFTTASCPSSGVTAGEPKDMSQIDLSADEDTGRDPSPENTTDVALLPVVCP